MRIAGLTALAYVGFAGLSLAHAGITCYDKASYSSNFVSAVQQTLSKQGFDPGAADGKWGRKTEGALQAYQRSKLLRDTGQIDPATLRALFGPGVAAETYGLVPNRSLPAEVFKQECR